VIVFFKCKSGMQEGSVVRAIINYKLAHLKCKYQAQIESNALGTVPTFLKFS